MQKTTRIAGLFLGLALTATPAFAVNKDIVQLQVQVQQLQDAVARLQQSNDERMGVLRDLVQQSADSVNKMTQTMDALQQQLRTQQEASGGKLDQVSGQVQSLNDSVDEVKARLNSLEKALKSVQDQQQSINAAVQSMAPNAAGPGGAPAAGPAGPPSPPPVSGESSLPPTNTASSAPANGSDVPFPTHQGPPQQANSAPNAPPAGDLYKTALADFMSAKYSLATSEFQQVAQAYPDDPLAGNSYYYLGEIDYRAGRYAPAVKNYDHVVTDFPANPKVPVARLHKGMALLAMKQREAGIREMRSLIQRYPNSPEAVQARNKLNGMGVPVTARRPS